MNAALGSTWWSAWTANLARQVELAMLVVAGAALVWLLLLLLFHGRGEAAEEGPAGGPVVPFGALGMVAGEARTGTREEPAPVTVAPGVSAVSAEPPGSPQGGYLSPTDVIALKALRGRIRSGRVVEDPIDIRRLEFARWLLERGKLAR